QDSKQTFNQLFYFFRQKFNRWKIHEASRNEWSEAIKIYHHFKHYMLIGKSKVEIDSGGKKYLKFTFEA
ncbi:MAG: hypothetical protein ABI366_06645, partial [Ginsengibacter sp.]